MRGTFDELIVRRGQAASAQHHNNLVALAEELTIQQGALTGRRDTDGFLPDIQVSATLSARYPFRVSAFEGDGGKLMLTFSPGHVTGIVPTIGDVALGETDKEGNEPALEVPTAAWTKKGMTERALVMFRYELRRPDFAVAKVVPVAVPSAPVAAPWRWHKLIAILTRTDGIVKIHQQCYRSQDFFVTDANAETGRFTAWPSAAP